MNRLMEFINLLGYGTSIVFYILIYHFLDLIDATDIMFKLFWWWIGISIVITILSKIANKLEEYSNEN